jgi:hypothetical protein
MAMFGNKHSHNDFTTDRWVLNLFIAMYTCLLFCSFHILNKFRRCIETQQYKQEIVNHVFQKDLEAIANAWATKFVNLSLQPHLSSWLQELDILSGSSLNAFSDEPENCYSNSETFYLNLKINIRS